LLAIGHRFNVLVSELADGNNHIDGPTLGRDEEVPLPGLDPLDRFLLRLLPELARP